MRRACDRKNVAHTSVLVEGHNMTNKLLAEFFGTFWLVLGGCGSAVLAAGVADVGIGWAGVSLAFGLTVLTMAYAVGHISGGHLIGDRWNQYATEAAKVVSTPG